MLFYHISKLKSRTLLHIFIYMCSFCKAFEGVFSLWSTLVNNEIPEFNPTPILHTAKH